MNTNFIQRLVVFGKNDKKNDKINELKLFNDFPVKDEKQDSLGFGVYSQVISEIVQGTPTPLTIGVFAEWGMGKTSLMNLSKQKIDSNPDFVSVWFNAWQYENEKNVIVPLIATIVKELEKSKTTKKIFKAIRSSLKAMLYSINMEVSSKVDGMLEAKASISGKDAIDKYDELMQDVILERSLYYDAYKQLEEVSSKLEDKNKIVIFIDDLDRCMPNKAVKLLENIKLILSQHGFVFVLGVAKEVIEDFLVKRYVNDFGAKEKHAKSYLDKIVQIPIYLPSHISKTADLTAGLTNMEDNLQKLISIATKELDGNPRTITRLVNRIKVNTRLHELIENENKTKEQDIAIACLLQEIFPKAYNQIKKYKSFREYITNDEKNIKTNEIVDKLQNEIIENINKEGSVLKEFLDNVDVKKWIKDDNIREKTIDFISSTQSIDEIDELIYDGDLINRHNQWLENTKTQDTRDLKEFISIENKDYEFSKYLVTNSWYEEFIKDGGYDIAYFKSDDAKEYLNKYRTNIKTYKDLYEKDQDNFLGLSQPIVNVSYYEAQAFCEWLNSKGDGYKYSLPTKEQFEYVAGKNGKYPWGDEWNKNYCNNANIKINSTSVVGIFPDGNSKDGICDMSGNVWKWTSTKYNDGYYYQKGGSWYNSDSSFFAVSCDYFIHASDRDYDLGFFLTRTKVSS